MPGELLFEQRWPVDEDKLRRAQRGWMIFGLVIGVLGGAAMVGAHDWGVVKASLAALFIFSLGLIGSFAWGFNARMRRAARLRVRSDGTLEVKSLFTSSPSWRGVQPHSFALGQCREVGLKKAVAAEYDEGPDWVYRYHLVVMADKKHEFMLPGLIGSGGNQSTLSDEQAAAFHTAVGRFTTAAPG